jgi:crotonobetaine/carnitine-CoA ligase
MAGIYNEPPKPDDADNPVRVVISAGTPAAIWEDFEKRFNVKIHEWYAAVEGGLAHNPPGKGPVGSFGKPNFLMYRMKIVDENDKEAGPFVKGELISKMTFRPTKVDYFGKKKSPMRKQKADGCAAATFVTKTIKVFFSSISAKEAACAGRAILSSLIMSRK